MEPLLAVVCYGTSASENPISRNRRFEGYTTDVKFISWVRSNNSLKFSEI